MFNLKMPSEEQAVSGGNDADEFDTSVSSGHFKRLNARFSRDKTSHSLGALRQETPERIVLMVLGRQMVSISASCIRAPHDFGLFAALFGEDEKCARPIVQPGRIWQRWLPGRWKGVPSVKRRTTWPAARSVLRGR